MPEKIVSWFKRNYGGSLNEDYQPTGMKFSFFVEEGDKLIQCHDWVKCKDYLHDVVRTALTDLDSHIYGFKFTKKDNPMIHLDKTRMLVSWAGVKDAAAVGPKLVNGIKLLNYFEEVADVELSKFEKVSGDKEHSFNHVWAIESPKLWMTHPHLVSLYTFLLRFGDKNLEFTDKKSFDKAVKALLAEYANKSEKDVDYLKKIHKKLYNLVVKRDDLSSVDEAGYSDMYREEISIEKFHNRSGIISTCDGTTGSIRFNKLTKTVL